MLNRLAIAGALLGLSTASATADGIPFDKFFPLLEEDPTFSFQHGAVPAFFNVSVQPRPDGTVEFDLDMQGPQFPRPGAYAYQADGAPTPETVASATLDIRAAFNPSGDLSKPQGGQAISEPFFLGGNLPGETTNPTVDPILTGVIAAVGTTRGAGGRGVVDLIFEVTGGRKRLEFGEYAYVRVTSPAFVNAGSGPGFTLASGGRTSDFDVRIGRAGVVPLPPAAFGLLAGLAAIGMVRARRKA